MCMCRIKLTDNLFYLTLRGFALSERELGVLVAGFNWCWLQLFRDPARFDLTFTRNQLNEELSVDASRRDFLKDRHTI